MKRILSIDVDGVLNCTQGKGNGTPSSTYFMQENMEVLKKVVEETGAEIMLHSSWNRDVYLNNEWGKMLVSTFVAYGLEIKYNTYKYTSFADEKYYSLDDYNKFRTLGIVNCLNNDLRVEDCAIVIIDDDDFLTCLRDCFIQIPSDYGLTEEHVEKIKNLFEKQEFSILLAKMHKFYNLFTELKIDDKEIDTASIAILEKLNNLIEEKDKNYE